MRIYEIYVRECELDLENGTKQTLNIETITEIAKEGVEFCDYMNSLIDTLLEKHNKENKK